MVRLLSEIDRAHLVRLLDSAPQHNLLLKGNLDAIGFDRDFCQFWGDFGAGGVLRGVVNRYMTGWSVFGAADAAWRDLAAVIDAFPVAASRLQDNPGGVESVLPFLTAYRARQIDVENLMCLALADFRPAPPPPVLTVRRASLDDLPELVGLYADAGDMTRSAAAVERPLRDTQVWIGLVEGHLVSSALVNAQTKTQAMVGGVYSAPDWRGQGFSRAVCSALCAELLNAGQEPVLYWRTPAAGAVYRRLGFRPIGVWRSAWLETVDEPA